MEGAIQISARDYVAAGYEFRLPGSHPAADVTFSNASVTISGRCSNGGTGTITIWMTSRPYHVAAGDAGWQPGSATYQGAAQAPASLCGGAGTLDASSGATFTADVHAGDPAARVDVAFHYRDPKARGQANVDCSTAAGAAACAIKPSGEVSLSLGGTSVLTRAPAVLDRPAEVPGLKIVKLERLGAIGEYVAGPIAAPVGAQLDYRITVTNTTGASLDVTLSAPRCDAGSLSPSAAQTLLAGQSLAWECRHALAAADGSSFRATASAVGLTAAGSQLGPVSSAVIAAAVPGKVLAAKKVLRHRVQRKPQ
jgi:hypothetical protein